jgi:hypothetical protein
MLSLPSAVVRCSDSTRPSRSSTSSVSACSRPWPSWVVATQRALTHPSPPGSETDAVLCSSRWIALAALDGAVASSVLYAPSSNYDAQIELIVPAILFNCLEAPVSELQEL